MNFTREPIIETIISAKEGYKLKIKNTRNSPDSEYLVDAVQVVSFGSTFFYRSCESAVFFLLPTQEFEIVQVRQSKILLKVPVERSIKIAGGNSNSTVDNNDKTKDKKKNKKNIKEDKVEEIKEASKKTKATNTTEKTSIMTKKDSSTSEKKTLAKNTKQKNAKQQKKLVKKIPKSDEGSEKTSSNEKNPTDDSKKELTVEQQSIFSNLLRPPEALISDNIKKYHDMVKDVEQDDTKDTKVKEQKENITEETDGPQLISEQPKPFETLEESLSDKENEKIEEINEKPSLSLRERVKKALSPPVLDE